LKKVQKVHPKEVIDGKLFHPVIKVIKKTIFCHFFFTALFTNFECKRGRHSSKNGFFFYKCALQLNLQASTAWESQVAKIFVPYCACAVYSLEANSSCI
jgi:hypothetical protein